MSREKQRIEPRHPDDVDADPDVAQNQPGHRPDEGRRREGRKDEGRPEEGRKDDGVKVERGGP